MSTVSAAIELPWQERQVRLRAFIARRVRHHADVDDLVQRVLLQIVTGLGALRDAEQLHAWVYRVARNAIVDYYRSPLLRREVPSGDAGDLTTAPEMSGPAFDEDERKAFGVSARDPRVYAGVALLILVVTLLASALPTLRAARSSPLDALRIPQ